MRLSFTWRATFVWNRKPARETWRLISFFYALGGAEGGAEQGGAEQGGAELGEGGGGGERAGPFKIIFACILLLELSKGNAIVFFILHQLYL